MNVNALQVDGVINATAELRRRGTVGLSTHRWREPDSNHRSRKAIGLLGMIPIDLRDRFFSMEKCGSVGK